MAKKVLEDLWGETFGDSNDSTEIKSETTPYQEKYYPEWLDYKGKEGDDSLKPIVSLTEEEQKEIYPNVYKEHFDEASKELFRNDLNRAGVSLFDFDKRMKVAAKGMNMSNWSKAKRYADVMSSTVEAEDIEKGIQEEFGKHKKNDLLDTENILNTFRAKDANGNVYYKFNGEKLYGEDAAREIISEYVDERNHWINMRDKDYRENWSMQTFGIPYESYVESRYQDRLKPQLEALEEAVNAYINSDEYKKFLEANQELRNEGKIGVPDIIVGELSALKNQTDSFRDASFFVGVKEGAASALDTALFGGAGEIVTTGEQAIALDKANKGEPLTDKEKLLVEMFKYEEALNDEKGKFREGWNAADVGSGTIQAFGYMANMFVEGTALGGGIIKKGLEKGAIEAFKEGAEISTKEGLKRGLKQSAKNMAYGIADDALRAPINGTTYQAFAERSKGQFHMTELGLVKEETNPLADMYRAYAEMFTERGSERLGDFIDDGIGLIGRSIAQTRWAKKAFGRTLSKLKDFAPSSSVIEGLCRARVQGLAGEYISERANEYIMPILTGEFFTTLTEDGYMPAFDKHYADVLTSESALSTLAICGALAGTGQVIRFGSGAKAGYQIANLRKKTNEAIESIKNETLSNDVYSAVSTNDYNALSKIKWADVSVEDANRAMTAIFNSAKVQNMRGELSEVERLNTFMPLVDNAIASCYRGVDFANPTPTLEQVQIAFTDAEGNVQTGNVLYGDYNNPNAILTVVDNNGQMRSVPVVGAQINRVALNDFIAEQYALAFSTSIAKDRLEEVINNVRGFNNMSNEAREKVIAENGFSVYKQGDIVTLADGRQGIIAGNAGEGTYNVEVADDKGNKVTLNVGFEMILNESDTTMAQAQMEAMADGSMEAPIVLPTDKDGNIKLNDINDGKTLAMVMPSQFGSKQNAIDAIDAEIARLKAEESNGAKTKQTGLDAIAEAQKNAEARANRIKVLEDARVALAGQAAPNVKTADEIAEEREAKQAEKDAMSTFDFSRDYRSRVSDSATSARTLAKFAQNAEKAIALANKAVEELDTQISAKEAEVGNAFADATSEADMERINEETQGLQQEIENLKAKRDKAIKAVQTLTHRKAQYEQTLKDMGVEKVKKDTLGENKNLQRLINKASEILGMPIIIGKAEDFPKGGNAKHVVRDGKNLIVVNPNATDFGSGVGILAHEICHEFKQFLSPKDWAKFEDLVNTARFGADWRTNEEYKKELKDITDTEIKARGLEGDKAEEFRESFKEKAIEEAVTYGIEYLIFDGKNGIRAFEAIIRKHDKAKNLMDKLKTIWDRVRKFFSLYPDNASVNEAIAEFDRIFAEYIKKEGKSQNSLRSANGTEMMSRATYRSWVDNAGVEHKGTREEVIERMKEKGFSQEEIDDMIERMDTAYEYMGKLEELTDADGHIRFEEFNAWAKKTPLYKKVGRDYIKAITSLVSNGDYPINLEITTDCIKREAFTQLLNELVRRGADLSNMGSGEIVTIQKMMKQYGLEVACNFCFVEGKRLGIVNWASQFVEKWNDALREAGVETDEYFNFGKDGEEFNEREWDVHENSAAAQKVRRMVDNVGLILTGRDPEVFREQALKNHRKVEAYVKAKAEAWAKRTKRPVEEWTPTKAQASEIKKLRNEGMTPVYINENMKEYNDAFNAMRNEWMEKHPNKDILSFEPTKKQWDELDKIRNRQIEDVHQKMIRLIMEHPEMRKKMVLNDLLGSKGLMDIRQQNGGAWADFYSLILQNFGTTTPKPVQDATPYDGEIMTLTEAQFKEANKIGGARLFSFSDFDITKVFDYMQMFFDLEANEQKLQSYTKEVAAIILFGRSNAKFNISILANAYVPDEVKREYILAKERKRKHMRHKWAEYAGLLLDENGNIIGINFSKEHSVNPAFAQEIFHDDTRNKDCGAIMVGASVNHAIYSAMQDWIRMVIPFHLSGMPLAAREKTDVMWYTDNTEYQNTRKKTAKGWGKLDKEEKDFKFYDDMDKEGWNMRDKAREYIAWCEERGYLPKFDWGINSDHYRAYCEANGYIPNQQLIDAMDADTKDGVWNQYYKFLTDFTAYKPVFNEQGEMINEIPSPQLPVKANFDFSQMEKEVLFEGEDSILAHREENIKRVKEYIEPLAAQATAYLNGDVTEEELGLRDDVHYENYADAKKYLEAKVNALNKLPEGNRNVVDAMDVESYSISRNTEATIDKWFDKRGDFTEETKAAFKTYIADFKPATQLVTAKWYVNGVIRLPEDMPKVEQAMEIAQRKKVDALQYNSPMELIEQFGVVAPKEKLINPDDVPTLSNKTQVPNTDITIYDVDDSEESRKNFRELMNSHLGKESSPWCLLQADENGVLIKESARYWKHYNRYPKRAAFNNGKLVAFFASDGAPTWWDRMDKPHSEIPIVGKIKGDALGRTATMLVSESGEMVGYDNIHKGDKKNGLYEEWYDLEQMHRRGTFVNGKQDGEFESWYKNGVKQTEANFKDGIVAEYRNQWYEDGKISQIERFNNSGHKGFRYNFVRGREDKSTANFWNMSDLEYVNIRWGRNERCSLMEIQNGDNKEWFNFGETGAVKTYSERRGSVEKQYVWLPNAIEAEVDLNMFGVSKYFKRDEQIVRFEDGSSFMQYPQGDIIKHSFKDVVAKGRTYRVEIDNWDDGNNKNVTIFETTENEDTGRWQNTMLAVSEGAGGWSDLSTKMRASLIKDIKSEIDKRYDAISKADEYIAEDMEKQRVRMERLGEKFDGSNVPIFENLEDGIDFLHTAISEEMPTESFSLDRSNESYSLPRTVYGGNSGYVGYSKSKRAVWAEEEGRYPKTAFKKAYNMKDNVLSALTMLGIIDNTEWHHTSVYGNRTPYYGWVDEEFIKIYAENKEKIDALVKEFDSKDWEYRGELPRSLRSFEDWAKAQAYEVDKWSLRNYLTAEEMASYKDEQQNISDRGDNIGTPRERAIMHSEVDAKYVDHAKQRYIEQNETELRERYQEEVKLAEESKQREEYNNTTNGKEKIAKELLDIFGMYATDKDVKSFVDRLSYNTRRKNAEEVAKAKRDAKVTEVQKKQDAWMKRLRKEGRLTDFTREKIKPANSVVLKEEMNGKNGWFGASMRYSLPTYYSGITFDSPRSLKTYEKYEQEKREIKWSNLEVESFSILRNEDTDTIFATAKEEFESTNDWKKTGWLMPDGTQLDFAEGGDYRGTDHRAIGAAYKGTAEHQWQYLQDFENRGGIRIHMNRDGKYGTLEMSVKPTADQKKKLRSFIGAVGGNVDVDFMDENYNTVHSVSYDGVSPARVLSGITNFYDNGIKPKGNVSYSLARLPKVEYGRLSSIIMTRQHTYHRPSFDYAFTLGKFYVYNYLGDGDFIVNFALPIEDKYKEAISLISKSIDDGVVNSTGSLNSFLETARSGEGNDIADLVNVLKERAWYQGIHTSMPSRQGRETRGVSNVGKSDSGETTTRGANRRNSSSNPQSLEESYSLNRTDIDYLDAINRGDMATAQKMVDEAAKKAGYTIEAYHGTDRGGFTSFDASESDDRMSFFFAKEREVAKSYTPTDDDINLGEEIATFKDAKEFLKDDGWKLNEGYTVDGNDIYDSPEDLLKDWELEEGETIKKVYEISDGWGTSYTDGWVDENEVLKVARTLNREEFGEQTGIYNVYLKMNNPMEIDAKGSYWNEIYLGENLKRVRMDAENTDDGGVALYISIYSDKDGWDVESQETIEFDSWDEMRDYIDEQYDDQLGTLVFSNGKADEMFDFAEKTLAWKSNTREIAEDANALGYDGVIIHNVWDNGNYVERQGVEGTVYILFDPNNIKAVNTITVDDNGNIIPLSERFNTANDDIRYSISRDEITVATPELVDEANPSSDDENTPSAKAIREEIEKRIDSIATKKNVTFKEIHDLLINEDENTVAIRRLVRQWYKLRNEQGKDAEVEREFAISELKEKFNLTLDEAKRKLKEAGVAFVALQESTQARYNKIINTILDVLKTSPSTTLMGADVAVWVKRAMTDAYLDMADTNIRVAQRDIATILRKVYEAKNKSGEKVGKTTDYITASILNKVKDVVEKFYQRVNKDGEVVTDINNVSLLWEGVNQPRLEDVTTKKGNDTETELGVFSTWSEELETMLDNREKAESEGASKEALEEMDKQIAIQRGAIALLGAFSNVYNLAHDIKNTEEQIAECRKERNELLKEAWKNKSYKAKALVAESKKDNADTAKILEELRKLGYADAFEAEMALAEENDKLDAKTAELSAFKRQLASEKLALLQAMREFATAYYGAEKDGRIAFKENKAMKMEQALLWRRGILRSVRNPLFRNTIDYDETTKELKDERGVRYGWAKRLLLRNRGDAFLKEATSTFEYEARMMDVMSIPNAWLHTGYYYQMMLHPTEGVMARTDWRYHTERQMRSLLDVKVKETTGYKTIDDLKDTLNQEIGIEYNVVRMKNGEPAGDTSVHSFKVDEALYIRAVIRQEGIIGGYFTAGLEKEQIDEIVARVEERYPELCALCDWIQGAEGIYERLYAMNNVVYRKKNDRDLDHTPNYCPVRRVKDTTPTESNIGDTISASRLANGIGSNKKRIRNNIAMNLNAGFFSVLDEHISEVIQWVAFADLFSKMNSLLGNPTFKKMMKVQGISKTNLENCFLRATGERLGEGETGVVARTINTLAKNAVAANVVSNLNTALKQMASIVAILGRDFNPELWAHFVKNFPIITNISTAIEKGVRYAKSQDIYKEMDVVRSNYTWALQNIPTFAERVDTGTIGMDIFKQEGWEEKIRTWNNVSQWIKSKGMAANRFMDIIVCASVGKTIYEFEYKKNRKRGLSHEQAHDDARFTAAVFINQTQQSDQGAFVSALQSDRKGVVGTALTVGFTAYNNSQFAFDRNARSALINLLSLSADGGSADRVRMLSEEYESRGMSAKDAKKFAMRDYRVAFSTQLMQYIANTTIAPIVWAMQPVAISFLTNMIVALCHPDDGDDEAIDIIQYKLLEEVREKIFKRGWIYLLPTSNIVGLKGFADAYFETGFKEISDLLNAFDSKGNVVVQPLMKFIVDTKKLFDSRAKENDAFGHTTTESEMGAWAFGLHLLDIATRYGLGVSSKTMMRMGEGLYNSIKRGNIEDFMNATTQSGKLTKLYASAVRKDERQNIQAYIERVAGAYKIVDGYMKGVDMRLFEKQYIERMDEIMFHNTDFDYDKFKREEKIIKRETSQLSVDGNYETKEGMENVSPEKKWVDIWLITQYDLANRDKKELNSINNWDEKGCVERKKLYKQIKDRYDAFSEVRHAPTKEVAMESLERIAKEQKINELTAEYTNDRGRLVRSKRQIEREAERAIAEMTREREEFIKEYYNKQ